MIENSKRRTSVFVLGFGRVTQLAIVFLTFKLITSLLSSEEVGFYFLLQALAGFFLIFVISPLGTYLNREVHEWEKMGQVKLALKYFLLFSWCSSLLAGAALSVFSLFDIGSIGNHEPLIQTAVAVYIAVVGSALANTIFPLLNILGRPVAFVFFTVFTQALALGLSFLIAKKFGSASIWWITTGLVQIVFGTLAYIWLRPSSPEKPSEAIPSFGIWAKAAWKFSSPIAIANLAVWGLIQGYRPLVESFSGLDALAVVGLGLGLSASITAAFESLVQQIFLPRFYKRSHSTNAKERESNWNQMWRAAFLPYMGLCIVIAGLSPLFIEVLSGNSFPDASKYLAIGAFAELARMSGNLLTLLAQSERNLKPTQTPYWAGALVALLGCLVAVQTENMEWVAWSLVLGQCVATFLLGLRIAKLSMFRVSASAAARFLFLPLLLIFGLGHMGPLLTLSITAVSMAAITLHYWWQEGQA